MGRRPYYRKALKAWYILHDGRQTRLGRTKTEAYRTWKKLLSSRAPAPDGVRVSQLVKRFEDWCAVNRAPATIAFYHQFLSRFDADYGDLQAASLRPHHLTDFLRRHDYDSTTGNCACRAVMRLFNWCEKQGIFGPNPLRGTEKPAAKARETYITREQWAKVLSLVKVNDPFRDLILFLWETGCRPQEARAMERRHFDPDTRSIVFPKHEAKGRRKPRIIVLNDAALEIVNRGVAAHPVGPLLRNVDGGPWTVLATTCRFKRLRPKLGFYIHAYAMRHTFATNALMAGVEPMTVATLMGHSSIGMIWSVYQKLQAQGEHMRAAAERATRGPGASMA